MTLIIGPRTGRNLMGFHIVVKRRYTLQHAAQLGGEWSDLETLGPVSDSGPLTVEAPAGPDSIGFYRLRQEP